MVTPPDEQEHAHHARRRRTLAVSQTNLHNLSAHAVHFYETEDVLLDTLEDFIGDGLRERAACIVIGTPAHRSTLEHRLRTRGIHPEAAHRRHAYVALDATTTLSQFLVDGQPDRERFFQSMEPLFHWVKGTPPVRLFGEMVAVLWEQGHSSAALHLELLWNEIRALVPPFALLCAYPTHALIGEPEDAQVSTICQYHDYQIPEEQQSTRISTRRALQAMMQSHQQGILLSREQERRTLLETRMQEWERNYTRLFEASLEGMILADAQTGIITNVNPFALALLDTTREQVLGQEAWHIGLGADHQAMMQHLQQVRQQHVLQVRKCVLRTQRERAVEVVLVSVLLDGRPMVQYHLRDLTLYGRMEAAVRASETHVAHVCNLLPMPLWRCDLEGHGLFFNTTWCSFTGLSEEESLGTGWIKAIRAQDRNAVFDLLTHASSTETQPQVRIHLRLANGDDQQVPLRVHHLTNPEGTFSGANEALLLIEQSEARF